MFGIPIWKVVIAGVLLTSLLASGISYRNRVWHQGYDAALQAVAAQNEIARLAANKVKGETTGCFDRGGNWNVATGTCDFGGN